jgi:hypothetical protein
MGGAAQSRDESGPLADAEALRVLRLDWGSAWAIGCGDDRWQAAPRDGTGHVLTRTSADGLALALRIICGRQPS